MLPNAYRDGRHAWLPERPVIAMQKSFVHASFYDGSFDIYQHIRHRKAQI